ncbi:21259_t:CDS:2, partial [Cetraspora pellucida]
IGWSKLTLNALKGLCMSCSLSSVGNKKDLSDRLQAYFGKNKGKATDKSGVGDDEDLDNIIEVPRNDADERDWDNGSDANLELDDMRAYSQEADNRIKDELVGYSQGRKKAEQIKVDMFLLAIAWPKVSLSKPWDQYKYDFLVKIGKCLDKAIKVVPMANKKDFDGIRDEIEAQAATLSLADNKGWGTALQIVRSNDKMMEKYKNRIRRKDILYLRLIQKEMKVIRVKGDMIEAFNPFVTEKPLGFQNVKESLTASTVEALVTSPPAALPQ